ncbi:MAG: hypothetical protein IKC82_01355 [Lentisphaeria bacterium]|nr:hypothetical protein [Lentisphaeria bacterium]
MKKLIRPAMLLLPLAAGVFLPQLAFLAQEPYNFIRWALMGMIFLNLLQINFADLKPCREHFILLLVNIALGIVPFWILKYTFPDSPVPAQAAFFTGIAPTAAAAAVVVSLLGGRTGFAVTGFVISNLGIALALLFLLPLVTGNFSAAFFGNVFHTLVMVIAIPLLCARTVRRFFPQILRYKERLKTVSLSLWSLSLLVISSVARRNFDLNSGYAPGFLLLLIIIPLVLCIAGFAFGWLTARKDYRRDASQILGQKNTTFAIYIALEYACTTVALAPIFYVLFHNLWNSIQLSLYKDKNREKE